MKTIAPIATIIILVLIVIGGWWYEQQASQPQTLDVVVTQPTVSLSGKAVKDAADAATTYVNTLKVNGKVPLDASGLPRNPSPLFTPAQ